MAQVILIYGSFLNKGKVNKKAREEMWRQKSRDIRITGDSKYPPCGFNEYSNNTHGDKSNSNYNNNNDNNNDYTGNKHKNINGDNIQFCNS